jgi:hypothetical protein
MTRQDSAVKEAFEETGITWRVSDTLLREDLLRDILRKLPEIIFT